MLGNRQLILDTHCEIYDMIKDYADGIFWNLDQHIQKNQVVNNAIYVIGRKQLRLYNNQLRDLLNNNDIKVVFSNPHEGSEIFLNQCVGFGIADLVKDKKILLVTGGNLEPSLPFMLYDSFLPKVLDYRENIQAIQQYRDLYKLDRPYKFLFLNGRVRHHRSYMLKCLQHILDTAIWTNLDIGNGPIKLLEPKYEVKSFNVDVDPRGQSFVKDKIFPHNTWGDIIIDASPYLDTYFSLVSETVHGYPYSFRTEKIWKPVAIGHPWIAVANQGFYKDIRNLGFKTFNHVIDESFDQIENNEQRMDRVAQIVEDLCKQNLASFLQECYNVCKYNQQHLAEMSKKVRQEFPERFFSFLKEYII